MGDSFSTASSLSVNGQDYRYYSLEKLSQQHDISRLPFSLKILLENLLRHEDGRDVTRDDILALGAGLAQVFSTAGILVALNKALEVPLGDILKSAWSSSLSLQAYLDPEKHPPEETSSVSFGKHKLSSNHQPKIEVLLNQKRVGTVSFDVTLTLHITSTKLLVRDGRIWEASGTEFRGEFKAAYKGLPFIKKKIGKIKKRGF